MKPDRTVTQGSACRASTLRSCARSPTTRVSLLLAIVAESRPNHPVMFACSRRLASWIRDVSRAPATSRAPAGSDGARAQQSGILSVALVSLRPGEPADDRFPRPVGQPADQQGLHPGVGSDQVAGLRALPAEARTRYARHIAAIRKAIEMQDRQGVSSDKVAAAVEHALFSPRPKTRYLVGTDARVQALLVRWLPDRPREAIIRRFAGP